jgi:hypothetical protein
LAYRLALPPRAKIHNVFHVVSLKAFKGEPPVYVVQLPDIKHSLVLPVSSCVVKARLNRGRWKVRVCWAGRASGAATWELLQDFEQDYPDFQLEDELFSGEGGSVVDSFYGTKFGRRPKKAQQQASAS